MGIDSESDIAADLQIGPTTLGKVRLYLCGEGIDLPLDFEPDEAEEIAEELRAAAERARAIGAPGKTGAKTGTKTGTKQGAKGGSTGGGTAGGKGGPQAGAQAAPRPPGGGNGARPRRR